MISATSGSESRRLFSSISLWAADKAYSALVAEPIVTVVGKSSEFGEEDMSLCRGEREEEMQE
jgi:hypothetical protein